jgi:branched-chain amino acid transport system permease protein
VDIIVATIINGILMGGVYGLTAMGLTLIFGVMKVINFAHGSFLMAAMFVTYYLFRITGIDPYAGLVILPGSTRMLDWLSSCPYSSPSAISHNMC